MTKPSHAFEIEQVRRRLEAGNGGYEVVHTSPGLEVGVYVLVAPEPDHQQPHADVVNGFGAMDGFTTHHFDVVGALLGAEFHFQRSDRADLDPPAALDQAAAGADVDDPDAELSHQHRVAIEQAAHPRLTCCSKSTDDRRPVCSRSRWHSSPSTITGRLSITQTGTFRPLGRKSVGGTISLAS